MKSKYSKNTISRRTFLQAASCTGLSRSLPLVTPLIAGVLANREAQAQDANENKAVFVYLPNGAPDDTWLPDSISHMRSCTDPLLNFAEMCSFSEVTIKQGGGHGNIFSKFGATSMDPNDIKSSSINFQLADAIGHQSPFSSVELGVASMGRSASGYISRHKAVSMQNEDNPLLAYERLFAQADYSKEQKVLELNRAAVAAWQTKLGQTERERLEEHLHSLEVIDNRLNILKQAQNNDVCNQPEAPSTPISILDQFKAQADIAVAALQCNLTQVISLQISNDNANWVGTNSGIDSTSWSLSHHQACHTGSVWDNVAMVRYLYEGVHYLIHRLNETRLIESTMMMQFTCMGNGRDHTAANAPSLITSNMPHFQRGRIRRGGTNEDIFADVFRGMGVENEIGKTVGDYGSGLDNFY